MVTQVGSNVFPGGQPRPVPTGRGSSYPSFLKPPTYARTVWPGLDWNWFDLPHSWGSKAKAGDTFARHAVLSCAVLTHSATGSSVPVFDVVRPAYSWSSTFPCACSTAVKDGCAEIVCSHHMPKVPEFSALYVIQQSCLVLGWIG